MDGPMTRILGIWAILFKPSSPRSFSPVHRSVYAESSVFHESALLRIVRTVGQIGVEAVPTNDEQ